MSDSTPPGQLPDGIEYNLVNPGMTDPSELELRFSPIEVNASQKILGESFVEFAGYLDSTIDDSREKSLMLTRLEETFAWAQKALDKSTQLNLGDFGVIEQGNGEVTPTSPDAGLGTTETDGGSVEQPASEATPFDDGLEDSLDDSGTDGPFSMDPSPEPVSPVTSELLETRPIEIDETTAIPTQEDISTPAEAVRVPEEPVDENIPFAEPVDDGSDHVVAVNPDPQPNVIGSSAPLTEDERRTVIFGEVNAGTTTEGQL